MQNYVHEIEKVQITRARSYEHENCGASTMHPSSICAHELNGT